MLSVVRAKDYEEALALLGPTSTATASPSSPRTADAGPRLHARCEHRHGGRERADPGSDRLHTFGGGALRPRRPEPARAGLDPIYTKTKTVTQRWRAASRAGRSSRSDDAVRAQHPLSPPEVGPADFGSPVRSRASRGPSGEGARRRSCRRRSEAAAEGEGAFRTRILRVAPHLRSGFAALPADTTRCRRASPRRRGRGMPLGSGTGRTRPMSFGLEGTRPRSATWRRPSRPPHRPHALEWDETKHFRSITLREAAGSGWRAIYVDEESGGTGWGGGSRRR